MSSIAVDGAPSRGIGEIVGRTFRLSRLLFTFPFCFSKDNLNLSYKYFFLSLFIVGYVSVVSVFAAKDVSPNIPDPKVIKSSVYSPAICFTVIPLCNLFWLLYKKNRMVEFFKIIRDVEVATGYRTPDPKTMIMSLGLIILIANMVANYKIVLEHVFEVSMVQLCVIMVLSVLTQFNSLIKLTKSQYGHILDTLDHSTVERWCCCREELAKCSKVISDCYAPQLLLMVTSNFVSIVCGAYQFAVSAVIQSDLYISIMYAVWASVYLFVTWFIIYLCDSTLSCAKKFDNLVYYMVINDPTKTLVRNKRILIHFKTNRKEEFSAMGFFNFDYPLLCSMVSSATTYIVILVQFS